MIHQAAVDEDYENQISSSSLPTNHQRASHSQLLTKIYYPDTLYPDTYSFFADRGDTASSSRVKSPLPMDTNVQYPTATTTTDPTGAPTILTTVSRQPTTEIEIVERQSKYPVSNKYLSHFVAIFTIFHFMIPFFLNVINILRKKKMLFFDEEEKTHYQKYSIIRIEILSRIYI